MFKSIHNEYKNNISSTKSNFNPPLQKSFKRTFSNVKECRKQVSLLGKPALNLLQILRGLSNNSNKAVEIRQSILGEKLAIRLGRGKSYSERHTRRVLNELHEKGFISWVTRTKKIKNVIKSFCYYQVHLPKWMGYKVLANGVLRNKVSLDMSRAKELVSKEKCPSIMYLSKYLYLSRRDIRENTQKKEKVNQKDEALPFTFTKKEGIQEMVNRDCPWCGVMMFRYHGKWGEFLGCPNKRDGCKYKENICSVVSPSEGNQQKGSSFSGLSKQPSPEVSKDWQKSKRETTEFCQKAREMYKESLEVDVDPLAMFNEALDKRRGIN